MGLKAECDRCGRTHPARGVDQDALSRHIPEGWLAREGVKAACSQACAEGGEPACCVSCSARVTVIDPDKGTEPAPGTVLAIIFVHAPRKRKRMLSGYICIGCASRAVTSAMSAEE